MLDPDYAFYSDIGGRSNNEDSYLAKRINDNYIFIVADGLGGHEDGEKASCMAVDSIKEFMCKSDDVVASVCFANNAILDIQAKYSSKMKTTVAIAYITEKKTVLAHVGDTRIYAFKNNKIVFQSIDHSASQLAVTVGEIRQEDIRMHEDRNILLRALGADDKVKVDVTEINNSDFDALLLCSDGFWEYVLENEMEENFSNSDRADKWLYKLRAIQVKKAPKNCDNNTAIAIIM